MVRRSGKWHTNTTSDVYQNPFFRVREDEVIRPDGTEGKYYVIEALPAAFIVALDDDLNVYMVGLNRYAIGQYSLEVPAGSLDSGEKPLKAAQRELQEETGLTADTWQLLGITNPMNGSVNKNNYIFLAQGLHQSEQDKKEEEGIMEVRKVSLRETLRMVQTGEIKDEETIAALSFAALKVGYLSFNEPNETWSARGVYG